MAESKVKQAVKKELETLGIFPASKAGTFPLDAAGWYYMPVPGGYGVSGIPDFLGHFQGRFFSVETKSPGKKPSKFQQRQIDAINCRGERAWVIDSVEAAAGLKTLLYGILFLP